MPYGLKRFQQAEHLHFITFSCHHRQRLLFVVYTETTSGLRIIGARLATATERNQYEEVS